MSINQRVQWLFQNMLKPDGSQYTNREVEEATGGKVTARMLFNIRHNRIEKPNFVVLRSLAMFFKLGSVTYFYEDGHPKDSSAIKRQSDEYPACIQAFVSYLEDNQRLLAPEEAGSSYG